MIRSIRKRDEILTMTSHQISQVSAKLEREIKEFVSSMMNIPIDELRLKQDVILSVKEYVSESKNKINIGTYDACGFFTISMREGEVALMVRKAMGYQQRKEGPLSNIESLVFAQYLMPYVESIADLLNIDLLESQGLIQLSRFNYADEDFGLVKRYEAMTEAGSVEFSIFVSQSLLRRSIGEELSMSKAAESILVDLVAELYIKEMPITDINKMRVGDRINLPTPDSVVLREKLTENTVISGELGEVSDLKSIKITHTN